MAYDKIRSLVPTLTHDRYMADDIERVAKALRDGVFLEAVESEGVQLR